jgi:hypothetical protein
MSSPLRREVPPRRPRGNRFWFRATAISFTIKVALVVILFLALRAAM